MVCKRKGFTLIELVVVVLIVGILAAFAVPSYLKSVETTKADDAVALVNMIGTTNRMFALDHANTYVAGTFPAGSCGAGTCTPPNLADPCTLVYCRYLSDQDFGSKPYTFYACGGAGSGACGASGGSNSTAGARRKSGIYSDWGYAQDAQGVITAYGIGVPAPNY